MKILTSQYLCIRHVYKKKIICLIPRNGETHQTLATISYAQLLIKNFGHEKTG